jgi:hypothetical protein
MNETTMNMTIMTSRIKIVLIFILLLICLYYIIHSSIILHFVDMHCKLKMIAPNFIFVIVCSTFLFIYFITVLSLVPKLWIRPFNMFDCIPFSCFFLVTLVFGIIMRNFYKQIEEFINTMLYDESYVVTYLQNPLTNEQKSCSLISTSGSLQPLEPFGQRL